MQSKLSATSEGLCTDTHGECTHIQTRRRAHTHTRLPQSKAQSGPVILSWPRPFAASTPGLPATVQLRGAVDKNHHLPLEGTAAAWLKAADRAVTGERTQAWPVREEAGDGDSIEEPQGPRSTVPSSCPGSTPRTLPEQERRVAQPKGMGGVTAVWESGTPGSEPRRCTHASREVLSTRFPLS